MNCRRFGLKSTTLWWLFPLVFALNAVWLRSSGVGILLLAVALGGLGMAIGRACAPNDSPSVRLWLGVWQLLSGWMVAGAAVYYVHSFPAAAAWALALLSVPAAWFLGRRAKRDADAHDLAPACVQAGLPWFVLAAAGIVVFGLFALLRLLAGSATTQAVASPWNVVPPAAFAALGLAALALAFLWFRGRERRLVVPLTMLALLAFLAVNLAVFPLGSGFDAFIHRATEAHIAATGSITPKPLYYAGQYVLVAFLHHAFALPVDAVDLLLLPLLAALLLPLAWLNAAEHLLPERRHAPFTLLLLFLLPLGLFATTTPQGLADLWILLLVLASVPFLKRLERPRVYVLALPAFATVAVHPLAGLPALLYVAYLACDPAGIPARWETAARWLRRLIVAAGALLLPASFLAVNGGFGGHGVDFSGLGSKLLALFPAPPAVGAPYRPALDFAVLLGWLAGWIVLALAVLGWKKAAPRARQAAAAMGGLLLVNFILLGTVVDFSFLIDYERGNYAARLVPLILFFLAPLALVGLGVIRARLGNGPRVLRWFAVAFAAALVVGAWYAAYPRDDAYLKGHGYNVSAADFDAVKLIEADAHGAPYVALADQSVSVAALSTIGFRYYGDQFFYPIPTGGDLYQKFLDMNAAPSPSIADAAMDLVAPNCRLPAANCPSPSRLYFAVDSYWWNAPAIIAAAKANATSWFSVGGGAVMVFRYDR